MPVSNSVIAERFINLRILSSTIIPFGLMANYGTTYALQPTSWVDVLHLFAGPFFIFWLVLILANGFENLWSNVPIVRSLLGDDSTIENRRRAQGFGFWAMIVIGVGVYTLCQFVVMPDHKAAQLVVVLSISAAGLRFGYLEQRALSLGQ
ncbi:MAG: hypothetical protein ABL918_03240 [Chakrabartia sp.]